jgi:hypothetical protein
MYKMWQKIGKQRNPDEWEMSPATVNAYYNPPANEVSEILQLMLRTENDILDRLPGWHPATSFLLGELVRTYVTISIHFSFTLLCTGLDTSPTAPLEW